MSEPTAGERELWHLRERGRTYPPTPDAGDASEPLSEDERAAVYFEVCPDLTHTLADGHDRCEEQAERLIAIVASREAAAATRARAEAWEQAHDVFCPRQDACSTHLRPGDRHLLAPNMAGDE